MVYISILDLSFPVIKGLDEVIPSFCPFLLLVIIEKISWAEKKEILLRQILDCTFIIRIHGIAYVRYCFLRVTSKLTNEVSEGSSY